MRTKLAIKTHAWLERLLPERRLFLKSDTDTRFIRLRSSTQLSIFAGGAAVLGWAIIATAVLVMDNIGAGNFREQAKRDQQLYEERLNNLAQQRDDRAEEALAAQERFNAALDQISIMQSELLASETHRRELETGIEVIQSTLRQTMVERESAKEQLAAFKSQAEGGPTIAANTTIVNHQMDVLSDALARTASQRDQVVADAQEALARADEMQTQIALMQEQNDQIFRQLEEAMTVSVAPLDKMFRAAGMSTDRILNQVRRGYSGQGGAMTPITFSTRADAPTADTKRANRLLTQMDQLNLYRIASEKAPFANPLKNSYRFTSPFGFRRHPITGGRRMHNGVDFAAPHGTPIYSTADGVVTFSGWQSGYGRTIKVQHEFGITTLYAHLSRSRVKVGQRVSRGERIGDMGNTGRSTGTHLHYEIRVGGKPVNPMIYIKAANDVF